MSLAQRDDPYQSFNFIVEIDGVLSGKFSEVSGLEANVEFDEYREGGVNNFVHKLPKKTNYNNLVLRRGMTNSTALYKWHQDVIAGMIKPKNVSIILLDSEKNEAKRWTFENAFPIKWTGPDLKADNNALAIESLEIVHQGLVRVFQ